MIWRPKKLTRAQMEERRMEGVRLLEEGGKSQAEIARILGVSPAAVSVWAKKLRQRGRDSLKARKAALVVVHAQRTALQHQGVGN